MQTRLPVSWIALALGFLACSPAGAQDPAVELEEAKRAYWAGRFEESIQKLDPLASRLGGGPLLREAAFFLGLNHLALGSAEKSRGHFETAVRQDPAFLPSENLFSPNVVSTYLGVRARLVGQLSVESTPPGAQVSIGGKPAGRTPYQAALLAGAHEVRVEAPGYAAQDRKASVVAGEAATLRVLLAAESQPALRTEPPRRQGGSKSLMIAGAGLAGLGAYLAATSKPSGNPSGSALAGGPALGPLPPAKSTGRAAGALVEELERNKGKLYGGIGLMGAGGTLIWLGARSKPGGGGGADLAASTDAGRRWAVLFGFGRRQGFVSWAMAW